MKRCPGILIFLLILILSSCSAREEGCGDITPSDPVQVNISGRINGAGRSRAYDDKWVSGDAVGIFMIGSGQRLSHSSISGGGNNMKYNVSESGYMSPAGNLLYYPTGNRQVDFIAYYPYESTLYDYVYKVDVSDQSDIQAIDLLYSDNVKGASWTTPSVSLGFAHKLSRVVMNITAGQGVAASELKNMTVVMEGVNTNADFDLADGRLSYTGSAGSIRFPVNSNGAATAIIIPTLSPRESGRTVTFSSPSISPRVWAVPDDTVFTEGNSYIYTVVITSAGVSVSLTDVDSWVSDGTETGTAAPD